MDSPGIATLLALWAKEDTPIPQSLWFDRSLALGRSVSEL